MNITPINSFTTAFIRPDEGANVGLIHTSQGMILIDTTSSPHDMRALFEAANMHPEEVQMVINTHSHNDHTWGNQLFSCPILAHQLCQKLMKSYLESEWSPEEFRSYISDLEKTDPKKAKEFRRVVEELRITLPSQVFDKNYAMELGGVKFEVIHLGGHTPDLSVVWLSEQSVLFASDLIFQGRYPYIFDADIPVWISQLSHLLEFNAKVIIPGHGVLCGAAEIIALREYLQHTWDLTGQHIRLRHNADETSADPAFPYFAEKQYERLHQANIRYMFNKQAG